MPKSARYILTWVPSHHAYELRASQRDEVLDIVPGGMSWVEWVSQVSSFAFHGRYGSYTARQEQKPRGEGYWYAYARVEGKLTKKYLGRSVDLTLSRLEQVAQQLRLDLRDILPQIDCADQSNHSRISDVPGPGSYTTAPPLARTHPPLHLAQRQGNSLDGRKTSPARSRLPTNSLLTTKLHVPHLSSQLVHRPRLIQRLQVGLERELTLLSAPAGFGKSTLLADWLTSSALPTIWLSLDPQDNDPIRFLSCLIAALQTYDPHLGTTTQPLHHRMRPLALETMLMMLLNDLLASRTCEQDHIVLVLDNCQVITDPSIYQALSFILDHLFPRLHLVLSTREDPPLPLARLRGRAALVELRAADLRFTYEETTTYLVEVMRLPLSTEESRLLHERTEGWIIGLQLAAYSLQGRDDAAAFITAFSGSHRYVVDYLLQEVLNRQPADVQDFLMQTCILERFCAPLCDMVRAQDGSQALLEYLERANLFLVALDDGRQWYRYHHLFAQVLYQRLQQTAPTLVPTLHQRASYWYEQQGLFAEAVSHALAASAFDDATRLIEQCAEQFISGSQMQALCEWLHDLPSDVLLAHPSLSLMHAIALIVTNRWEAASTRLQAVEGRLALGEDRQDVQRDLFLGQIAACWSLLARHSGDLQRCVALSSQALDLLPETRLTVPLTRLLHGEALLGAAHAYLVNGDVTPVSEYLLTKKVACPRIPLGQRFLLPKGLTLLARLQVLQGRLHQAAATFEEAVQVSGWSEELQVPTDTPAYHFGLGDLLREWNELEAAEQHLVQGMNLLKGVQCLDAYGVWMGYAALARLQQAFGRNDQALTTLDAFLHLGERHHFAQVLLDHAAAMRAHLELARGHLQAARRWMETSDLSLSDPLSYLHEREYLTLARIHIAEARGNPSPFCLSEVLILLERLLEDAEAKGRVHSMLEILVLCALALQVQGNRTEALATLSRALALAEPEGYIRLFLDEGPLMLALLRQTQQHGEAPGYLARLLAAWNRSGVRNIHLQAPHSRALPEPLTCREREVLQLLMDGASNREIAVHLVLSVNTVKKHVANICGKLNVQSRAQAIVRAHRLHPL
jgi:LuxR family maltose regulon positive regulatory protein